MVLPVKPLERAKSRLIRADRAELALAMATDTVRAAVASAETVAAVIVVTDDPLAKASLGWAGALVVPDVPDAGLNAALTHGAGVAERMWPGLGVAALSADLAALAPEQLGRALRAAARHPRAVVADAEGTGTVLLTAGPGVALAPAFGPASRAAHIDAGAVDLTDLLGSSVPGLRRDVDTADHLAEAVALGAGDRTRAVLSRDR
ncbi:MAG: 2-phospho-L-lactate guanylyltransferase [Frankia sp.]